MRFILILLALTAIIDLGLRLGWFNLSSRNDKDGPYVTMSEVQDKVAADTNRVVDKGQDLGHKAVDKIAATTQKAQD